MTLQRQNPKLAVLDALRRLRAASVAEQEVNSLPFAIKNGRHANFLAELELESWYPALAVKFCGAVAAAGIESEALAEIKKNKSLVLELGRAIVQNSRGILDSAAKNFKIDRALLLFVFETPLIPAFKEIALKNKNALLKEGKCPACGRPLGLGAYKERKRYLLCKLCGARYHVDLFWCPKCGNRDAGKLGFIFLEDEPEFRIDYCFLCNTYIKAADENIIGAVDDPLLFDIATLDLDALAREKKLNLPSEQYGVPQG